MGPALAEARVMEASEPELSVDEDTAASRFAELYRAHYTAVCGWVMALGTPPPQNEDVAQEVFLVAHRKLATFEKGRSFRAWLFGIARRVNRDHRRSRRRSELREQHAEGPSALPAAEDEVARREAIEFMHAFLDRLGRDKRLVFLLSDIDDMRAPEVAEALGVPVKTVRSRLRAAREKFKDAAERFRRREERRSGA